MNRNEIEKLLQGVEPELRVAFSVRCALRVLPLLVNKKKEGFWYWQEKDRSRYLLAILVAQQASMSFAILDISKLDATTIRVAADAAIVSYDAVSDAADTAYFATYDAAAYAVLLMSPPMPLPTPLLPTPLPMSATPTPATPTPIPRTPLPRMLI